MAIVLINAWDPRHNNVVLYENRYWEHIVARHPSVEVRHILLTVEEPDVITGDENNVLVENYYRQGVLPDAPDLFLKVCIRFESDRGTVVTAYEVDRPKPREKTVWKR